MLAIQNKFRFIRQGQTIVDLGAAPGSWSELAKKFVGPSGDVFALDILPIEPIEGVKTIQGDFTEVSVYRALWSQLAELEKKVDVVISDMAPNMSGILVSDQARSIMLVEMALDFAEESLKSEGCFLTKIFQGAGIDSVFLRLKSSFSIVKTIKPAASRPESREIYVLAQGFRT